MLISPTEWIGVLVVAALTSVHTTTHLSQNTVCNGRTKIENYSRIKRIKCNCSVKTINSSFCICCRQMWMVIKIGFCKRTLCSPNATWTTEVFNSFSFFRSECSRLIRRRSVKPFMGILFFVFLIRINKLFIAIVVTRWNDSGSFFPILYASGMVVVKNCLHRIHHIAVFNIFDEISYSAYFDTRVWCTVLPSSEYP